MRIAVTGAHAGCHRAPGVAVARCLQSVRECTTVVLAYDSLVTGLHLPTFEARSVLRWTEDEKRLGEQILRIHAALRMDALIPGLNSDVALVAAIQQDLAQAGIATLVPSADAVRARRKQDLLTLAGRVGLCHPLTVVCCAREHLHAAVSKVGCPCIVKGADGGVYPIHDLALFDYFTAYCAATVGYPIVVQEWKVGEEYSVHGLCDRSSTVRGLASTKKIGITDDGETWMSVTVDCEQFRPFASAFARYLHWVGPFEVDLLLDGDGDLHLLDVNPRFPAWVDGLVDHGFNMPWLAVQLALGTQPNGEIEPPSGIVLQKDFDDLCFGFSQLVPELTNMECADDNTSEEFAYRRV